MKRGIPALTAIAITILLAVSAFAGEPVDPCRQFCIRDANNHPMLGYTLETIAGRRTQIFVAPRVAFGPEIGRKAEVTTGADGKPAILIHLTREGATGLENYTRRRVGHKLAIFLGGELVIVPVVRAPFTEPDIVIGGTFTAEKAASLAHDLNDIFEANSKTDGADEASHR